MFTQLRTTLTVLAAGAALTLFCGAAVSGCGRHDGSDSADTSRKLVILHTNDTHSQIDPTDKNLGGIMRRKAAIDSIRGIYDNVLLVDAGDMVQGTLYFYLYGGAVEQEAFNLLGYDEGILGNHEFDNGIDSLASILRLRDRKLISSNYITEGTPLDTLFVPYSVREYGGKKIGIMGINLDPEGIIVRENYEGLGFMPIVATANATAAKLRQEEGVDAVIALTHIGYAPAGLVGDSILAENSRGIDIIVGGHSHDTIDPATERGAARSHRTNLDGKDVLVVQTGKSGVNLGKIEIDLDSLGLGGHPRYELIRMDSSLEGREDPQVRALIDRYYPGVDSLMHDWIGTAPEALPASSTELLNFFADWVKERGEKLAGNVDLAIVNKGGLRASIPEGRFSKGHIINMLPFRNYITVVDLKGSDLLSVFEVMASTAGNGVSDDTHARYRHHGDSTVLAGTPIIDGRPLNPDRTYRVATIDYLAKGNDYMTAFRRGTKVADSDKWVYDELLDYFISGEGHGRPLTGDDDPRWTSADSDDDDDEDND